MTSRFLRLRLGLQVVPSLSHPHPTNTRPALAQQTRLASNLPSIRQLRTFPPNDNYIKNFDDIPEKTKVQDFLDYVASTTSEITLEDVERVRPLSHASPGTAEYEVDFEKALDALLRAFTVKQLHHVIELYGGRPRWGWSKRTYAVNIVEQHWDWPSPIELLKQRKDRTEVVADIHSLASYELIILLGRDGVDMFNLAKKYNVRLSLITNPLALQAQGVRESLRELGRDIANLKENISQEVYSLPEGYDLSASDLQHISRQSGVFVESAGPGSLRIYFRSDNQAFVFTAKRLALQALLKTFFEQRGIWASFPKASDTKSMATYSLYPFISPALGSWVNDVNKMYRMKEVVNLEVDAEKSSFDRIHENEFSREEHALTNVQHFSKKVLEAPLLKGNTTRTISGTFGHSIFVFSSHPKRELASPLTEPIPSTEVLPWLSQTSNGQIFVPITPLQFFNEPATNHLAFHRLTYAPIVVSSVAPTLIYEVHIHRPDSDEVRQGSELPPPACILNQQATVDLLLPERSSDLQICVCDSAILPHEAWPEVLIDYNETIQKRILFREEIIAPIPPLTLQLQGNTYILSAHEDVRQFIHDFKDDSNSATILLENTTDLGTHQKASLAKIIYNKVENASQVISLLDACDRFTLFPARASPIEELKELLRASL